MKTESEQVPRWDDIIFENRNKAYGAYAIRKSYGDNVLTGWVVSIGVIAVIFLSSFLRNEEVITQREPVGDPFIIEDIPIIQKPETPNTQPPPRQPDAPRDVPPVVVDHDVIDVPPSPDPPPISGGPEGDTGEPAAGSSTGTDVGNVTPPEPPKPEWVLNPEVMPEFEGGYEGLMHFLQRKLRYPAPSRRRGEEGVVYVSFVISATGAVTHVELIRGVSRDLDQEAMRVISMMDKWKPGLQNKMPVAVKMVLPIKFKLDS